MSKATHYGECQACGRRQKLPGGVLSIHGYEVAGYGYFAGICGGSGRKPYETHRDYVLETIGFAETRIEAEQAYRARLLKLDGVKAGMSFVHLYGRLPYDRQGKFGYRWEQCEVRLVENVNRDGSYRWITPSYLHPDSGKFEKLNSTYGEEFADLDALRLFLVGKFIEQVVDKEIAKLRVYKKQQQARYNEWVLKPLVAIDGKGVAA